MIHSLLRSLFAGLVTWALTLRDQRVLELRAEVATLQAQKLDLLDENAELLEILSAELSNQVNNEWIAV